MTIQTKKQMRKSKPLAMLALLQDSVLIEHGAACLAAMSLRSPTNSAKIVECGAIEVLVRCMRSHSDKSSMQRQGQLNALMAHTHTHTIMSPGNLRFHQDVQLSNLLSLSNTTQHTGCLCIRNIAGRCPDLRAILLDAGVESVLRKAGTHRYTPIILP